jgi:uncharacterized protein YdeI (YjbR/CyaY-like superfamily)
MSLDYEIIGFEDQATFRKWLEEHGADTQGIWMRIQKKSSPKKSITYAEALDEALCYGWIDGQKKSYDEYSFLQKFTPRRPRSMWSKRNIEHIQRLKEANLMTAAGLLEVEKAKNDGRWAAAYDAPSEMQIPKYFIEELSKHPRQNLFMPRSIKLINTPLPGVCKLPKPKSPVCVE